MTGEARLGTSVKLVAGAADRIEAGVLVTQGFHDVVIQQVLHPRIQIEVSGDMVAAEQIHPRVPRRVEVTRERRR